MVALAPTQNSYVVYLIPKKYKLGPSKPETETTDWRFSIASNRTTRARSIAKLKNSLTVLAYVSLALDICIAVVTSVGALKIGNLQALLIPVNYALTAVVILSAAVLLTMLVERFI